MNLAELDHHSRYSSAQNASILKIFMDKITDGTITEKELYGFMNFSSTKSFPWALVSTACNLSHNFLIDNGANINWNLLINHNSKINLTDEIVTDLQLRGLIK